MKSILNNILENHYNFLSKKQISKTAKIIIFWAVGIALPLSSCKKYVLVDPPTTSILGSAAYSSDPIAISVLNGLYGQFESNGNNTSASSEGSFPSLSYFLGLSADEYSLLNTLTASSSPVLYYANNLASNSVTSAGTGFWQKLYNNIYTCNAAIEGLNASTTLTPGVKQELLGEAKFMRGLFYFYLVNLYGDVPLQLTTDFQKNSGLARSSTTEVNAQIISDLIESENLLSDGYLQASLTTFYAASAAERVRPNKYAAAAMLARVYLFTKDYQNALAQSSLVINNTTYYGLTTLNNVFLKNSKEAIWQLQPVSTGFNTPEGVLFNFATSSGPTSSNPVWLSTRLLNSFETGDLRRQNGNWVNSLTVGTTTYVYPYKYKVYLQNSAVTSAASLTEYSMVLRLGEQYLIRAEAEAQLNQLTQATADLNAIRTRAGLANTTATTQQQLLTAILHERQVELFCESGQRWLDLKRTGNVDAIMGTGGSSAAKGGNWNPNQALYPIYFGDIQKDQNLTQNPGY